MLLIKVVESQIKSPDFISNGWLSKLVSLLIILSILAIENIYLEGGVVKILRSCTVHLKFGMMQNNKTIMSRPWTNCAPVAARACSGAQYLWDTLDFLWAHILPRKNEKKPLDLQVFSRMDKTIKTIWVKKIVPWVASYFRR